MTCKHEQFETKHETHALCAEIAVAIAGVDRDDYFAICRAIDAVLKRYGIKNRQTVKETSDA